MVSLEIQGNTRSDVGKKGSATDRKNGLIPAVLYGGKEEMSIRDRFSTMIWLMKAAHLSMIK